MMQWRTLQQDWGKTRQGEETRGEEAGEGRRVVLGAHPETKEKEKKGEEGEKRGEREARWKNKVHLTSAHMCFSHATMPCYCCVRSASMCMPMCGNVMHGISCHHHHDELFVCQCVLQPAIPVCMCVCVCAEGTPVQAAAGGAHTQKRRERESVCVRRERGKQPSK